MTAMIGSIIAGICMVAFTILWFIVAYRVLTDKYREVGAAMEQIKMHYAIYRQEIDSSNAQTAKRMLDTSRMIFWESLNNYNHVRSNPIYRFPGVLLGFRLMKELES